MASIEDLTKIWQWNAELPETVNACVHDLMGDVIRNQPDAPAVYAWDGELTYRKLDSMSTELAHVLVYHGVRPGVTVPLYFEKSMWTSVAILGVMKAGGASVLLDASLPRERLETILKIVDSRVIVTKSDLVAGLLGTPSSTPACVVHVDDLETQLASISAGSSVLPPATAVTPQDPMYLIFTSGSTGVPKGVIITHSNVASAVGYQQRRLGFTFHSRVLEFASYSFDITWYNLFQTFCSGGCLCVPSEQERRNDLSKFIVESRANFADLSPNVAMTLDGSALRALSVLELAGEALPEDYLQHLRQFTKVRVAYGPSECTAITTVSQECSGSGCIGRGMGACTWVVADDKLVPVGTIGELWLEGPLVGAGYLNNPERTAASFIENPHWLLAGGPGVPGRGGRLYCTGDLVRYDEDGDMAFLGRCDQQVKIRGQRVELGDVEHHVRRAWTRTATEVVKSTTGDRIVRLVAEVAVPIGGQSTLVVFLDMSSWTMDMNGDTKAKVGEKNQNPAPLEQHTCLARITRNVDERLAAVLPTYLIPSAYLAMSTLPQTASGKIDRRQLREMVEGWTLTQLTAQNIARRRHRRPPSSAIERRIQSLWAEVLNIDTRNIGRDDSFPRVGGDSITAMQLVSRARAQGLVITVADVLRAKTLAELAALCEPLRTMADESCVEVDEDTAWPLSPIQRHFLHNHPTGSEVYNQSFLLELRKDVDASHLRTILSRLLRRHPMLRARFHRDQAGSWQQKIAPHDDKAGSFAIHDLLDWQQMEDLVHIRQSSMDILKGPVFAIDVFCKQGEKLRVLFTADHLVIDLVSWRIIWHDLEQLLSTAIHGPSSVPDLPVMHLFPAWCALQEQLGKSLTDDDLADFSIENREDYWGIPSMKNLYGSSVTRRVTLDRLTSEHLFSSDVNDPFRTNPLEVMMGVLLQSFSRMFPDRCSPTIFLEGHGRQMPSGCAVDPTEVVGWFTTLYPVQVPVSADDTLSSVITRVKDQRRDLADRSMAYWASCNQQASPHGPFYTEGQVEIILNFAGQYQQLERSDAVLAPVEFDIKQIGGSVQRMAIVEIEGVVEHGSLRLEISYPQQVQHRDRLENWISSLSQSFADGFSELEVAAPTLTRSDVPLLKCTSIKDLDRLVHDRLAELGITASDVVEVYPCTPLQEGVLLSMRKRTASYHTIQIWRCCRGPAVQQWVQAWKQALSRHCIFATIFVDALDDGGFLQVQLARTTPHVNSLSAPSGSKALLCLQNMPVPDFQDSEPAYHVTICHDETGAVACRLDMNHALVDATSYALLAEEVEKILHDQSLPRVAPFRAAVQHIMLQPRETTWAYWASALDGAQPCILEDEPTSSIAKANPTNIGGAPLIFDLPCELTQQIAFACRRRGITRALLIHVAWALTLSQWTDMSDVCFGYISSIRDLPVPGLENMVGPLVAMLVARLDLSMPLQKMWKAAEQQLQDNFQHAHLSLVQMHRSVGHRDGRLFDTVVNIRHGTSQVDAEDDSEVEHSMLEFHEGSDPYDDFCVVVNADLSGESTNVRLKVPSHHSENFNLSQLASLFCSAIRYCLIDAVGPTGIDESSKDSFQKWNRTEKKTTLSSEVQAAPKPSTTKQVPIACHTTRILSTNMEFALQSLWARVLDIDDVEQIGAEDSFLNLGGDSIQAMRLVGAARTQGVTLSVVDIFEYPQLYKLARYLEDREGKELDDELRV